jgi:hypothetical protein
LGVIPPDTRRALPLALFFASMSAAMPARALDKQGAAHAGAAKDDTPDEDGFDVEGALTFGASLVNPTYGARPDNTGRALFRYAAHVDVDLLGRKLSVPLDFNVFTDREKKGGAIFSPTEMDFIGGLTTTWDAGAGGALEIGGRVEHDRPADRGGFSQTYADARARYLYSLAGFFPRLGRDLVDGDLSGAVTLGWFAYNPTYAARPDNSGLALFRYGLRTELSIVGDLLSTAVDGVLFTDRKKSPLSPSELDLTYEVIGHVAPYEVHLAYERDMPLDQSGLVQHFLYVLAVWSFDLAHPTLKPLHHRGSILSP